MPNYRFECTKCKTIYEDLVSYDETDIYPTVICPTCGSGKKCKLATACSFMFTNPIGTDRWNSDATGHDYRYKHKQPSVRREREMAEKMSHMGGTADIYKEKRDLDKNVWDFNKI